jgi:hypothetical protein
MKRLRGQERKGTSRSQFCKGDDREEQIETIKLDDKHNKTPYEDINIAHRGNSLSRLDRSIPIVTQPKIPIIHPIVNLCEPYIESVFFQYDLFPHNSAQMDFKNDKQGRIVKFTYYLDVSMGDGCSVIPMIIKANGHATDLLNYPTSTQGNHKIKGTFNSTVLEFHCNMKIKNDEIIRLVFDNTTASDVTIMAMVDLKYGEEDFE